MVDGVHDLPGPGQRCIEVVRVDDVEPADVLFRLDEGGEHLIFEDGNWSRTKKGTGPAFKRLCAAIESGRVHTVYVRETSRLYRRPRDLEDLLDLVEGRRVRIVALFQGEVQLDRALADNNILVARILVAVDAEEAAKISKRVRLAKASRRAEGQFNGGGRRAYGRTADRKALVADEAKAIEEAARRLLSGESLYRIVLDWNAAGLKTTSGNVWRLSTFRRMMLSDSLVEAPAILSDDQHALLVGSWTIRA
jgi:site-specific DNA recombinase